MVVDAVTAVVFVLVEGDKFGITHVLGVVAFIPAQAQELVDLPQQSWIATLLNFWWDPVLLRDFPAEETVTDLSESL